jgi:hypothetical protein
MRGAREEDSKHLRRVVPRPFDPALTSCAPCIDSCELSFSDARIRATVATFWGNMENDPSFLRGVRENRKIEELILMFVSVATKELQKEDRRARERNQVPDFEWK